MGNKCSKKHVKTGHLETLSSYKFEEKDDFLEKEHSSHVLYRELFKTNFCSPIKDILSNPNSKILDVGCGSGFWLMEMSADSPKPSYIGVDVAPVFPKHTFPNNINFLQHNFLEGLPFEDNTFDFIYMRSLAYEFPETLWENFVFQELARLLKPGGWLEIWDYDMELTNLGPTLARINQAIRSNLASHNINPKIIQRYHPLIKSIPSFSSSVVYYEKSYLPFGSHGSRDDKLGEFTAKLTIENSRFILQGPIGKSVKIKRENIESILDTIEREFDIYETNSHAHVFYVQKKLKKVDQY